MGNGAKVLTAAGTTTRGPPRPHSQASPLVLESPREKEVEAFKHNLPSANLCLPFPIYFLVLCVFGNRLQWTPSVTSLVTEKSLTSS